MDVFLVVATLAFEYASEATFVGMGLALLRSTGTVARAGALQIALLFVLFAFLDSYWLPALRALDASVSVGNASIAQLLGAQGTLPAAQLVELGLLDTAVWAIQVGIALWVANRFGRNDPAAA